MSLNNVRELYFDNLQNNVENVIYYGSNINCVNDEDGRIIYYNPFVIVDKDKNIGNLYSTSTIPLNYPISGNGEQNFLNAHIEFTKNSDGSTTAKATVQPNALKIYPTYTCSAGFLISNPQEINYYNFDALITNIKDSTSKISGNVIYASFRICISDTPQKYVDDLSTLVTFPLSTGRDIKIELNDFANQSYIYFVVDLECRSASDTKTSFGVITTTFNKFGLTLNEIG